MLSVRISHATGEPLANHGSLTLPSAGPYPPAIGPARSGPTGLRRGRIGAATPASATDAVTVSPTEERTNVPAVDVRLVDVVKRFGEAVAVDHIDLEVQDW
jgi:hypothetical protein